MITIEQAAMMCHELNRHYCQAIGDNSQYQWHNAPDWQKESAINGVQFHLDNPGAGPEASHDNWLAEKLADGWMYGPVKDEVKKTHPCCVGFPSLPREQQAKDKLFLGVVNALRDLMS